MADGIGDNISYSISYSVRSAVRIVLHSGDDNLLARRCSTHDSLATAYGSAP